MSDDRDLYPPAAPNAAYWNHVHRTGYRSDQWTLRRGDTLLGTFTPARLKWVGMFWQRFIFAPEPEFEQYRPLFDEELRLLDADWTENDLGEQHEAASARIDALGLTLVESQGWILKDVILHIDADNNAWFRA